MPRLGFEELVRFARQRSPFYRDLYAGLPEKVADPDQLPILDQEAFWKANTLRDNRVLTGPMHDGIVFKSGGTTGNPKFSVFSKEEWKRFNEAFGRGMSRCGIDPGDRVANLFYVGQLYGSFIFINRSIDEATAAALQLPVGGATDFAETAQILRDFEVNVLAGVPTTVQNLAEYVHKNFPGDRSFKVSKILFGGEAVFDDQRARLAEIFPGVRILSIGYASTDAGLLGYADRGCAPGEHRFFSDDTLLEIVDEATGKAIEEEGREGLIVITNFTRTLMPVIRYPVGDRGLWREAAGTPDRKFALMGRSEEAARIGLVKLYVQDVATVLNRFHDALGLLGFQLVIYHRDRLDGLVVRVAAQAGEAALRGHVPKIVQAIHEARPLYEEFVRDGKVHPIEVEWVASEMLETNPRTGKMKRVIDKRHAGADGKSVRVS